MNKTIGIRSNTQIYFFCVSIINQSCHYEEKWTHGLWHPRISLCKCNPSSPPQHPSGNRDTHQLKAWRGRLSSEVWWALERRLLTEGVTWQGNQGAMTTKWSILMCPLAGVQVGESVGTPTGRDAVKNEDWGGNLLSPQGETSGNIKQEEKNQQSTPPGFSFPIF